jgi:hypothetical protein
MEKQEITVVAQDKALIALLEYKFKIKKVINFKDYLNKLVSLWENEETPNELLADFLLIGEDVDEKQFISPKIKEKDTVYETLRSIYNVHSEMYYRKPKIIGFGSGAFVVARLNNVPLLYDINNHNNTVHLTSFIMHDDKVLDFDVKSNHSNLIAPTKTQNFEILAFSTYNISQSYTTNVGKVFKAERDFLEIEALKLTNKNSYCFLYDTPQKGESVLIDLTLQLLQR